MKFKGEEGMSRHFGWGPALLLAGLILLAGCTQITGGGGETAKDGSSAPATEVIGTLGHGIMEYLTEETSGKSYIVYEGGELEIKYGARTSGMAEQGVGFMIFIDGMVQRYRTEEESSYQYMHTCYFQDDVDNRFSFYVTPSIGQAGDELEMCIVSIYYPDYKPDMITSRGYGIYHHMLGSTYTLKYLAAAPEAQDNVPDTNMVGVVEAGERPVAEGEKVTRRPSLYIDGQDVSKGNYYVTGDKTKLQVRLEIADPPGAEYCCTFFINHEPVSAGGEKALHVCIESGRAAVIEAELDISDFKGSDTFYAVLVPCDKTQIDELALNAEKTNSVLLVKSEK